MKLPPISSRSMRFQGRPNRPAPADFVDVEPEENRASFEGIDPSPDDRFHALLARHSADPTFWSDMASNTDDLGLRLEYRRRAQRDLQTLAMAKAELERPKDDRRLWRPEADA